MPRIAMLEGYVNPFGGTKRKGRKRSTKRRSTKRRARRGMKQATRMKKCAKSWKRRHRGSYRAFMKKCLSGKIRVK